MRSADVDQIEKTVVHMYFVDVMNFKRAVQFAGCFMTIDAPPNMKFSSPFLI
jgi:hypothetical protein